MCNYICTQVMPSVHISYMKTQSPCNGHRCVIKEAMIFLAAGDRAALASTLLYRYVHVPQRAVSSLTHAAWVDPCICYVMCIDICYLIIGTLI